MAASEHLPLASVDAQSVRLPAAGDEQSVALRATAAVAFKCKVNKPHLYTCTPVFGVLQSGGHTVIAVRRAAVTSVDDATAASGGDRLVIELAATQRTCTQGGHGDLRMMFADPRVVKSSLRVNIDGRAARAGDAKSARKVATGSRDSSSDEAGKTSATTTALVSTLLREAAPMTHIKPPHNKITVVGAGQVGIACAYSMLQQSIVSELALIDQDANKVEGERLDLSHGMAFVRACRIRASSDYAVSAGSRICVITAGVRQRTGESRLQLVQRNVDVLRDIVPKLVAYSPQTILLVVSNPVDVLSYVAWQLSGLPVHRVLGSGTNLDSSRFRVALAQRLAIAPSSVHAWIIGEHGDASVPVWSSANVAGVPIRQAACEKTVDWDAMHRNVVNSAQEIIARKGYTSLAIGLSVAAVCRSVLRDSRNVYALSTNVRGMHGIDRDVFLSLPCSVGEPGLCHTVRQVLSDTELQQLHKCADALLAVQASLRL